MGSGVSNPLEGMSPEQVAKMQVAYASAKKDGLEGLDLIQVVPQRLVIVVVLLSVLLYDSIILS
jgi:hypothetical protein